MAGKDLKVALKITADLNQARREVKSIKDDLVDTSKAADAATGSQKKVSQETVNLAEEMKKMSEATDLKYGTQELKNYSTQLGNSSTASKNLAQSNLMIENSIKSLTPHFLSLIGISGGFITLAVDTLNKAAALQNLSNVSGMNVEQFQYYVAGAKKVGIEQEKLADIFKDTRDKVGDFVATGGGELKDFFEKIAPKVGVTVEQFKKLNGRDALQLYVDTLQKAGVSQNEMVFYLEAIANDATLLLPLLNDGGKGWKKYGDQAKEAGAILNQNIVNDALKAKEAIGTFQTQMTGVSNQLVAKFSPAIVFVAQNLDLLVKAGLVVAAMYSAKMVSAVAAATIEFIKQRIAIIAAEVAMARANGVALSTTVAMRGLLSVSSMLNAMGGLPGLAIAAASVAASFLLMPDSTDAATDAFDVQKVSVQELIDKYKELNAETKQTYLVKLTDQLEDQEAAVRKATNAMDMFSYKALTGSASQLQATAIENYFKKIKAGGKEAKTAFDELRNTKLFNDRELAKIGTYAENFNKASKEVDVTKQKIGLLNGTNKELVATAQNVSDGLGNIGSSAQNAAAQINGLAKAHRELLESAQNNTLSNWYQIDLMKKGTDPALAAKNAKALETLNADPTGTQTYFRLPDDIGKANALDLKVEKERADLEQKITKEKEAQKNQAILQKAIAASTNEQTRNMLMVYQGFIKTGIPDSLARYFTAEVGREGDFLSKNIFGTHKDKNNNETNVGIISWQKSRAKQLLSNLSGKGLLDNNGNIRQTQDAIDAQTSFAVYEFLNKKEYASSKNAALNGKSYKDLQQISGNNFIGWDIKGSKLSKDLVNKNIGRMDTHFNKLNQILGADPSALLGEVSKLNSIQSDFNKVQEDQEKNRISLRESLWSEEEKIKQEHIKKLNEIEKAGFSDKEKNDLIAKENKRYEEALSKRPEILKRVQDSLQSVQQDFLKASGRGLEADIQAAEDKYKQLKADLAALMMSESDPLKQKQYESMIVRLDFVIDKEQLTLRFNDAYQRLEQLQSLRKQKQDTLKLQFESGQISQPQYAVGLKTIDSEMKPQLMNLADVAAGLAERLGDAFSVEKVNNFVASLSQVDTEFKKFLPTADQLNERIAGGLTDAIMDWADGTKSAGEAFKQFASDFLREIAQMILKQMLFNAVSQLGGGGGVGGGIASGISAAFGYSSGGYTGAGGKYDPAGVVHKDEFVIRKESTSQQGAKEFLTYFNRYGMDALNKFKGYADGGLVAAPQVNLPNIPTPKVADPAAMIANSTSFSANQNFYLVDDPARILDVLKSGASQENLVVMMSRDPAKFKSALKIG
ncbi:hypothetical protein [Acinetobacter bereziniae]|uniref:hypothetical protein n=1 Tax=Acinetobacter bereziniae TaxID=106648 RepID=UPI000666DB93|nr:hypothetical protein [Acinetobacter bereziniae]